ncbi:hypothetical protein GCM10022215_10090 [Nocardioides fonticola]|uniref:Periplasmic binding protein domain-containing protein n=1 Tax=Nocardioides fonticola TaxID=450363 RepID=A0ABP7XEN2_9ACTN
MTSLLFRVRRPVLAGIAAGSLALLAACGGSTESASGDDPSGSADSGATKTIAFSPLGLQIPAMAGLAEGVKGYSQGKGFDVLVQDPNQDPQKQATDLQSVIESGRVAGAYTIAISPDALRSVVAEALDRKVPLVLSGTPDQYGLDGLQPGLSFDTIDYAALGKAVGEELGNCINEKLDGEAEVLMLINSTGGAGNEATETAAKEALAATAPGAKIVSTITGDERSKAQTDVGSALQGNPNITAVLGNNDEGALGALGAFAAAGKDLPCITEAGGNEETLKAAQEGRIYAVVALQFKDDMAQVLDTLFSMIADPSAPGVQLTIPQQVVKAGS